MYEITLEKQFSGSLALPTNNRSGWKGGTGTNALAYMLTVSVTKKWCLIK